MPLLFIETERAVSCSGHEQGIFDWTMLQQAGCWSFPGFYNGVKNLNLLAARYQIATLLQSPVQETLPSSPLGNVYTGCEERRPPFPPDTSCCRPSRLWEGLRMLAEFLAQSTCSM